MPRKSKSKPYDPAAAALANAQQRETDRARRKDPGRWGVANDTVALADPEQVEVHTSAAKREVYAKRLDPFQSLYARGGLSIDQHRAANRLFRDWCLSKGIKTEDSRPVLDPFAREPAPPRGPSDLVNVTMMDAHDRYEAALKAVGPGQAIILRELTTPAVMCGSLVIWRGVVERLTGETMAQVQAAVVRRACEDLRLVYEDLDGRGYDRLRASRLPEAATA